MPFDKWLQRVVLEPINMTATGCLYPPSVLSKLPAPYDADGNAAPFTELGWGAPDGGLFTVESKFL